MSSTKVRPAVSCKDSNGVEVGSVFLSAREFHYVGSSGKRPDGNECTRTIGARGGVKETIVRVRVSGAVKTWKTRPGEFRIPVKFGLYESAEITHNNAHLWHIADECPIVAQEKLRAAGFTVVGCTGDQIGVRTQEPRNEK